MEPLRIDIAGIVTGLSLVIGSVATVLVAIKKVPSTSSEEKAVSVTRINETDKKVTILIQQVDFLFDEISRLRAEKLQLSKQIAKLREELKVEKTDHVKTKSRLDKALVELEDKNKRILMLEEISE